MKIHHFFVDTPIEIGTLEIHDTKRIHQIKNVLRLEIGEPLALLDGSGAIGTGTITEISQIIRVDVTDITSVEKNTALPKTLYIAISKKDTFEWIAEKATEIGIQKIVPVITDRTIKTNLNFDRLKKIIQEAVEQSGRGIIPILEEIMTLGEALEDSKKHTSVFLAHQDGVKNSEIEYTAGFVGPEGGWTESELKKFEDAHIEKIKLAPFVLRTETAALLATSFMIQ